MTYGDGVANINIKKLLSQHMKSKKIATVTAVKPIARFGSLKINTNNNLVSNFSEKITGDNEWINGGFFVFNKKIFIIVMIMQLDRLLLNLFVPVAIINILDKF